MSVAQSDRIEAPAGAARDPALERLDWDSKFFGARMGRIVPGDAAAVTPQALEQARSDGFDHLILRLSAGDFDGIRAAEAAGMRLVDIAIDLARGTSGAPEHEAVNVRDGKADDLAWARDLSGRAFVYSRFFADRFFTPEQGKAFHRQWITNLWNGLASDIVVAVAEDRNAGFITCSQNGDEGRIVLIATDERARGRGVGRALVAAAVERLGATGAQTVRVKTQAANIAALNLYERSGFTIATSELTYSWIRNEGRSR